MAYGQPKSTRSPDASAAAQFATTPGDRSTEYGQGGSTRASDVSAAALSAASTATAGREPVADEHKTPSNVGKILGAVGLGTAAGGAGTAASRARDDIPASSAGSHGQPTTTTGVDSYTAPTQSTPQSGLDYSGEAPRHHRKESIPTTASPAGVDSPAAINAPIGGRTARAEQGHEPHAGRDAGLAAAGVGAGAGTAALWPC